MMVYKEFSSLINELGFSEKTLYAASNQKHRHYHPVKIPKGNGEFRQLYVPDEFLKAIQRQMNEKLLSNMPVSSYATAYRLGGSTKLNALSHVGQTALLKLDIRHFFDHLIYGIVKEKAFPEEYYSEECRILFSLLCVYLGAIPQGAPTSPTISNIIMKEFDDTVGAWCKEQGIRYTRYCDDMTFSGDFVPGPVISFVKTELRKMGLFLNTKKTVFVGKGQKHAVTGIVVNEKLSISADYKKKIRQEMYYCMKYGIESHIQKLDSQDTIEHYINKLLGKVNYVLSVEPDNVKMKEYKNWLQEERKCHFI